MLKSPEERLSLLRAIDADGGYTIFQFMADLISVDKNNKEAIWSIDQAIEKFEDTKIKGIPLFVDNTIREKGFIVFERYVYDENTGAVYLDGIVELMLNEVGGVLADIRISDVLEVARYFDVFVVDILEAIEKVVPGMSEDATQNKMGNRFVDERVSLCFDHRGRSFIIVEMVELY